MPHPDPTAADTWSRVLARLEGEPEPDAPTTTPASDTPSTLPGWWLRLAAVPTVASAAPPTPVVPIATVPPAPPPPVPVSAEAYIEPASVTLFRERCTRFARSPIASIFA